MASKINIGSQESNVRASWLFAAQATTRKTLAKTFPRPLPARPAGEAVRQLTSGRKRSPRPLPVYPAGEAVRRLMGAPLAVELLHLPGEPAGVEDRRRERPHSSRRNCFTCRINRQGSRKGGESRSMLADELLHLPGKPAGVAGQAQTNPVLLRC